MRYRAALALALLAGGAGAARAQDPDQRQVRRGFWLEAATGYGVLRAACTNCAEVRTRSGGALLLIAGGTLSRSVLLGVELQLWSGIEDEFAERTRTINVVAQWYPWRGSGGGLFLRGGTGLAQGRITISGPEEEAQRARSTGVALTVAAGLDVPISRKLALTFALGSYVGAIGDLPLETRLEDTIAAVYQVTAGVTVR